VVLPAAAMLCILQFLTEIIPIGWLVGIVYFILAAISMALMWIYTGRKYEEDEADVDELIFMLITIPLMSPLLLVVVPFFLVFCKLMGDGRG
jgi:hypothetical protein